MEKEKDLQFGLGMGSTLIAVTIINLLWKLLGKEIYLPGTIGYGIVGLLILVFYYKIKKKQISEVEKKE